MYHRCVTFSEHSMWCYKCSDGDRQTCCVLIHPWKAQARTILYLGDSKRNFFGQPFLITQYCSAAAGETSGTGDLIVNHGDTFTHCFSTRHSPPPACFSLDETCWAGQWAGRWAGHSVFRLTSSKSWCIHFLDLCPWAISLAFLNLRIFTIKWK